MIDEKKLSELKEKDLENVNGGVDSQTEANFSIRICCSSAY